jgi:hypothetical protein
MSPCIASHKPPPENRGGGAEATASSTASIVARTLVGQARRKSRDGTLSSMRRWYSATGDAMPGLQELGERLANALKAAQGAEAFIAGYLKGAR